MSTATTSSTSINVSTFVEVLNRSKLVDPKRLKHVLKSIAVTNNSSDLTANHVAEQLIVAGLITKWQAAQLLKSKYRGFFLGKYVIRKPLGKGGMGVVYEGEHSVLNTRVAIKILPQARNEVEKSVSRFLAEARAAAKLSHPNIVRVHDCDVIDGRRFMVMDLVEGNDLGSVVDHHGPLGFRNAILLLKQAAAGLGYAHDHGVTHRDVKPNNFLIDREGNLKVADMGLALFEVDSPDRHTSDGDTAILGTVDYLAPEQAWDSRKVDRRADMYSLGCTLYFMITGRPPFGKGTLPQRLAKHQTAQAVPFNQIRPDCPAAIWNLCQKMMAKKPQDRLQKMSDVVQLCDQLLQRLSSENTSVTSLMIDASSPNALAASQDSWNQSDIGALSFDGAAYTPNGGFDGLPDFSGAMASATPLSTAGPLATTSANWNQAGANPYSASAPSKKQSTSKKEDSPLIMAAVYLGLLLAVGGLGLSIYTVLTGGGQKAPYKPAIKDFETANGDRVIIVNEN